MPCFRAYRSFLSSGFGAAGRGLEYFTTIGKEQPFDLAILPIASIEHLCYNYYAEKTDSAFEKTIKKRQCIGTAIPIHLRRWSFTYTTDFVRTARTSIPFSSKRSKRNLAVCGEIPSICPFRHRVGLCPARCFFIVKKERSAVDEHYTDHRFPMRGNAPAGVAYLLAGKLYPPGCKALRLRALSGQCRKTHPPAVGRHPHVGAFAPGAPAVL